MTDVLADLKEFLMVYISPKNIPLSEIEKKPEDVYHGMLMGIFW